MKNNKRRKETHPTTTPKGYCLIFQQSSQEQSSNHLMFICLYLTRRDLNTKQMGQSKASFLTTYQNIKKSSVDFSKQRDMRQVTLWLSFLSGVNIRASCILSHYLTKNVYRFINIFILHGLFSAEFHNTNTTINVKGSVVYGSEQVLDNNHLMKGCVKDFSNSLDSNHERVAFTIFYWS